MVRGVRGSPVVVRINADVVVFVVDNNNTVRSQTPRSGPDRLRFNVRRCCCCWRGNSRRRYDRRGKSPCGHRVQFKPAQVQIELIVGNGIGVCPDTMEEESTVCMRTSDKRLCDFRMHWFFIFYESVAAKNILFCELTSATV